MHWSGRFLMYFELFRYESMLFWNWIWYISMYSQFSFNGNLRSFQNCILSSILLYGLSIHIRYHISLNTFIDLCILNSILFNCLSIHIRYILKLTNGWSMYVEFYTIRCVTIAFNTLLVLNSMLFNCFLNKNFKNSWLMHLNFDTIRLFVNTYSIPY